MTSHPWLRQELASISRGLGAEGRSHEAKSAAEWRNSSSTTCAKRLTATCIPDPSHAIGGYMGHPPARLTYELSGQLHSQVLTRLAFDSEAVLKEPPEGAKLQAGMVKARAD